MVFAMNTNISEVAIDKKTITENIGNSLESDIFINLNTEENKEVRKEKKKIVTFLYVISLRTLYVRRN